jgi:hypothetical protein
MRHVEPPMRPPVLRVEPGRDHMREPAGPLPLGASPDARAPERPRFSAANEPPDEPA